MNPALDYQPDMKWKKVMRDIISIDGNFLYCKCICEIVSGKRLFNQSWVLLDWLRRNGIWFFFELLQLCRTKKIDFHVMSCSRHGIASGVLKTRWVLEYWLSLFIIFFSEQLLIYVRELCSFAQAWMKDEFWHSKCKFDTVFENHYKKSRFTYFTTLRAKRA